jgi:hypothetical protein
LIEQINDLLKLVVELTGERRTSQVKRLAYLSEQRPIVE